MIYFYWLSFAVVARAAIILIPLRFCHFYTKTIKSCDALPGRAFLISFLSPFCFSSLRPVRGNASFCVSGVRCTVRTRRRTMPAIKWRKKTFFFFILFFLSFKGPVSFLDFSGRVTNGADKWKMAAFFPPLPISFLAPFFPFGNFYFYLSRRRTEKKSSWEREEGDDDITFCQTSCVFNELSRSPCKSMVLVSPVCVNAVRAPTVTRRGKEMGRQIIIGGGGRRNFPVRKAFSPSYVIIVKRRRRRSCHLSVATLSSSGFFFSVVPSSARGRAPNRLDRTTGTDRHHRHHRVSISPIAIWPTGMSTSSLYILHIFVFFFFLAVVVVFHKHSGQSWPARKREEGMENRELVFVLWMSTEFLVYFGDEHNSPRWRTASVIDHLPDLW